MSTFVNLVLNHKFFIGVFPLYCLPLSIIKVISKQKCNAFSAWEYVVMAK
jgi:hypothetical protein